MTEEEEETGQEGILISKYSSPSLPLLLLSAARISDSLSLAFRIRNILWDNKEAVNVKCMKIKGWKQRKSERREREKWEIRYAYTSSREKQATEAAHCVMPSASDSLPVWLLFRCHSLQCSRDTHTYTQLMRLIQQRKAFFRSFLSLLLLWAHTQYSQWESVFKSSHLYINKKYFFPGTGEWEEEKCSQCVLSQCEVLGWSERMAGLAVLLISLYFHLSFPSESSDYWCPVIHINWIIMPSHPSSRCHTVAWFWNSPHHHHSWSSFSLSLLLPLPPPHHRLVVIVVNVWTDGASPSSCYYCYYEYRQ